MFGDAKQYDVIIIGGSIAGLATAGFLNELGISAAVLDKQSSGNTVCTTAINPRSLYYLKHFGVVDHIPEYDSYYKIRGLKTFSYDHSSYQGFYDHKEIYPNHGHCFPRAILNDALYKAILNLDNVDYIAPFTITEVDNKSALDAVVIKGVNENSGDSLSLSGRVIVDAMGRSSFLAKREGLFKINDSHMRFATFALFSGVMGLESFFYIGVNEDIFPGYYTIFPVKGDVVMLSLFSENPSNVEGDALKRLHSNDRFELKNAFQQAKQLSTPLSFGPIAFTAKRYSGDKLLMVGDSTGFFDPLTGEGVTQAFLTSEMAAGAIADYLSKGDWTHCASMYDHTISSYKKASEGHAMNLQKLIQLPNAFNRFIHSLSENQEAANWQACAVGNVFTQEERISRKLWNLITQSRVS